MTQKEEPKTLEEAAEINYIMKRNYEKHTHNTNG
jgi:hypothetical protein